MKAPQRQMPPSATYPFTEMEAEMVMNVIPTEFGFIRSQTKAAIRANLAKLFPLLKALSVPFDPSQGLLDSETVTSRLTTALRFLHLDLLEESHSESLASMLLGRMSEALFENPPDSLELLYDRADLKKTDSFQPHLDDSETILGCVVSLLLQGDSSAASELLDDWKVVSVVARTDFFDYTADLGREGKSRVIGPLIENLKILRVLSDFLRKRQIPSYGALKQAAVREFVSIGGLDETRYSRLLKRAGLVGLVPYDRLGTNRFTISEWGEGRVYGLRELALPVFPTSEPTADFAAPREFTLYGGGADQTDDDYTQHNITAIRESLGPAYFAFLIMFSMEDLETAADLIEFEDHLRARGLLVDWSQKAQM